MNKIDFENKITLYLNDELDQKEKTDFEKAIEENLNFKNLVNDILLNDKLLKSLPKVNVSKDFMYSLDKKIEDYKESNNRTWYNFIREFTFNIKPAPALSAACIAIVVCFSIVKIYDYDLTPNFLKSKHKYNIAPLNNYIAVNDSDSLNSLKDSLNHPNLLFGND